MKKQIMIGLLAATYAFGSVKIEDNLKDITNVSFNITDKNRDSLNKLIEKYGKSPKFSFPVRLDYINYRQDNKSYKVQNPLVYIEPSLANDILTGKRKVIKLNGTQKKYDKGNTFIITPDKDKPVAKVVKTTKNTTTKKVEPVKKEVKKDMIIEPKKDQKTKETITSPKVEKFKKIFKKKPVIDVETISAADLTITDHILLMKKKAWDEK